MPVSPAKDPSQKIFRLLLTTMARPGKQFAIPDADIKPYWESVALAVAETLLDHEVSFTVINTDADDLLADQIFNATQARPETLEAADYIFVAGPSSGTKIGRAKRGEGIYPDQGATVIYCIDKSDSSVSDPEKNGVLLSGPGIETPQAPEMGGLSKTELALIRDINSEYPAGIDAIFVRAPSDIMCIPRSTRIDFT